MGRNKLLLEVGGRTILDRVLDALRASVVDEIVVVLGHDPQAIRPLVEAQGAKTVLNTEYEKGMTSSFQAGLIATTAEAIFLVLGDQLGVDSDLIREMVSSTSFDAEIALRIDEHQRVAFYDTNNDGSFDLILVDYEGDSKADITFRLENDAWRVDAETQQEWLQIHHLEYLRGMVNRLDHDNALKKVRALLG